MKPSLEARQARPERRARARLALIGLWLAASGLLGCSWVLDPDALTAARLGPTGDVADAVTGDDAAHDAEDGHDGADAVASDADAHAAVGDADATIHGPDVPDDAEVVDVGADADAAADTDADTDADTVEVDAGLEREVVIARPGVGGCELDYKSILITGCPQSCPESEGWSLVFDASDSVGVESFHWEFAVTNNYGISPEVVTTARAEVTVEVPSCVLFGATMGSAKIIARLRVDGELTEHVADVSFSVRNVTSCGATQGNCASPP